MMTDVHLLLQHGCCWNSCGYYSLPVAVTAIDVLEHEEEKVFGPEGKVQLHHIGVVRADQAHDPPLLHHSVLHVHALDEALVHHLREQSKKTRVQYIRECT